MILSDKEILEAIEVGALGIYPPPNKEDVASTAVDLHLAAQLMVWIDVSGKGVEAKICPGHADYDYGSLVEKYGRYITMGDQGYDFVPGVLVLGWTVEKIKLPQRSRIAARVEGKSSLARLGIGVHVTAPTIHAGFGYRENDRGFVGLPLQLEMWNVGKFTIKLQSNMAICQIIFESVYGTPAKGYTGRFLAQGPPPS
jgi:dCTP deaminase